MKMLLVGTSIAMTFSGVALAQNECFPVSGRFESQTLPAEQCDSPVFFCTTGTLTGALWGDYDFVAQQFIPAGEPSVPAANFYTGFSFVYTRRGDVHLTDTGTLDLAAGRISALLTVTGGTDYFTAATGHLYVYGASEQGINSGRYQGEVCVSRES